MKVQLTRAESQKVFDLEGKQEPQWGAMRGRLQPWTLFLKGKKTVLRGITDWDHCESPEERSRESAWLTGPKEEVEALLKSIC